MSDEEKRKCDWCGTEYVPTAANQRYHTPECTRLATNKNIMDKYYERRAIKLGQVRFCKNCERKLSRYNPDAVCNACKLTNESNAKVMITQMLAEVQWQD